MKKLNIYLRLNTHILKLGIKLRDAIIDYCTKTDTINVTLDNRIKVINNE